MADKSIADIGPECVENAECVTGGGQPTCECVEGFTGNGFEQCDPLQCEDEDGQMREVSQDYA